MKTAEQVKPNYSPVYAAALYPDLAKLFIEHGYALAIHGSLARDLDLIAVPWVSLPSSPQCVIDDITKTFAIRIVGRPTEKPHGRMAYTISVGFGECAIDLSFLQTSGETADEKDNRITHLKRLETWASQDPTGPLCAEGVKQWVLNEIHRAMGQPDEPSAFQPETI